MKMDRERLSALWQQAASECGNCQHWMKKSSCPREAGGHGPSCREAPCAAYAPIKSAVAAMEAYRQAMRDSCDITRRV